MHVTIKDLQYWQIIGWIIFMSLSSCKRGSVADINSGNPSAVPISHIGKWLLTNAFIYTYTVLKHLAYYRCFRTIRSTNWLTCLLVTQPGFSSFATTVKYRTNAWARSLQLTSDEKHFCRQMLETVSPDVTAAVVTVSSRNRNADKLLFTVWRQTLVIKVFLCRVLSLWLRGRRRRSSSILLLHHQHCILLNWSPIVRLAKQHPLKTGVAHYRICSSSRCTRYPVGDAIAGTCGVIAWRFLNRCLAMNSRRVILCSNGLAVQLCIFTNK